MDGIKQSPAKSASKHQMANERSKSVRQKSEPEKVLVVSNQGFAPLLAPSTCNLIID